jgi:hypothetical protein
LGFRFWGAAHLLWRLYVVCLRTKRHHCLNCLPITF